MVGGGNSALDDALYLAAMAEKVYLIHRRDGFRAEASTVERVKSLIADKQLTAVEVVDKQGETRTIEVNGLFVAVGRIPENQNFAQVIALDSAGYALSGEDCHTDTPGVFVAGDNRVKEVRQLVTATADGAVAATEAIKYLNQ